jgi:hypothetical protein
MLNYNVPPPGRVTVARIKIVSKAKGLAPDEIEMRFPAYTEQPLTLGAGETPDHIRLEPGTLYCFYLKRVDGELWYVGALDGEADDGAAAQPAGTGIFTSQKEAVESAALHYLKTDPGAIIAPKLTVANAVKSGVPAWVVRFYSGKRTDDDSWDARIIVYGDKSIDDNSVVFGPAGGQFNKTLAGKRAALSVNTAHSSNPRTVRGVIQKVESRFVKVLVDGTGTGAAKPETFSKGDIIGMQLLPDSPPLNNP